MKDYFKRTWKNKLISITLILGGYLSMLISGDATFLFFILLIAVPLFFMSESAISEDHAEYYIDEDGILHEIEGDER